MSRIPNTAIYSRLLLITHLELLELMVDGHGELALAHSVPVDDHLNVKDLQYVDNAIRIKFLKV
jgi:hypothetical protein